MMTYSFEKLVAWQESRKLVKRIYTLSANFPDSEKYGLKTQVRRAVISISSNIAEGSGRSTKADQNHFYRMAFSSLMEVLNQLILCEDLEYIDKMSLEETRTQIDRIAALINGLVKL